MAWEFPSEKAVYEGQAYDKVTTSFLPPVDTQVLISFVCSLPTVFDYGKLFLKVSLTITGENCNDFESRQSSLSGSAFKLSGAKRTVLPAVWHTPETHFYIRMIVDYTLAGNLKMLYLMTGVSNHASTHPFGRRTFTHIIQR